MARIARVFASKTKWTPDDELSFTDGPTLFPPEVDVVHVSCVFTWDKPRAEQLAELWEHVAPVTIGGPAYDHPGDEFVPGMYMKRGGVITSRGCIRKCPFCFVPKREGKLRELKIHDGNVIHDNNLLACSRPHVESVFAMLQQQRAIAFIGGIDARLLCDWHIELLCGLRSKLRYIYMAYDRLQDRDIVEDALIRCYDHGMKQRHLGVYVLVGYESDTPENADRRCEWVFSQGGIPFAMYYRGPNEMTPKKPKEWQHVTSRWCSLPAMFGRIKNEGLEYYKCVRGQFAVDNNEKV